MIIAMDDDNKWDLERMCPDNKYLRKISKITDFHKGERYTFVPDPYSNTTVSAFRQ
ncbi:hypothetical protein ACFLSY_11275 [Bacteroidota bacterium]